MNDFWEVEALVDSGADGNFISAEYVRRNKIPWKVKERPYRIVGFGDSREWFGNGEIHMETVPLRVTTSLETRTMIFDITRTPSWDVVLGFPWLRTANPVIDWATGCIKAQPGRPLFGGESTRSRGPHENGERTQRKYLYIRKVLEEVQQGIPGEYQEFQEVFKGEEEDGLPQHTTYDHEIPLKEGAQPKFFPIYHHSERELQALREYIEEAERKGHIRPSSSPAGYPVLLVPKKDGRLRVCVDYRHLNSITVKNRYPIPRISELRDRLAKARYFTKLDLRGAYSQVRMKEGEEWKTAFRTRYGHYEYLVMPFGLTNAPASFQALVNDTLRPYLDRTVVAYLDDILIYSETKEAHVRHVKEVLGKLREHRLTAELKKSLFHA